MTTSPTSARTPADRSTPLRRIAVGVDGHPEGRDAAALGGALARITGAELILAVVEIQSIISLPYGTDSKAFRKSTERALQGLRATLAPKARTVIESDVSVPRALHRVVTRERRDLLVVGSSRQAPEGHVRIGKRTRQLLGHFECPLAVAPRGIHTRAPLTIGSVGVGFDGGPESLQAVAFADSIASAAGAELRLRAVVDDRVPVLMRSALQGLTNITWTNLLEEQEQSLAQDGDAAARSSAASTSIDVRRGRPADALLELSHEVDLIVVGSRRWGATARVLLGSTGEALMHDAECAVVAVPRPADEPST